MASSTEKVLKASDLKVKGSDSSSSTLVTRSRRSSASPSTFKKGSISKSASGSTVHDSAVPLPAANVPASVFSTVKTSSGAAQSRDPSKASRRGRRRSSGGELVSKTAPSYAVREGSRLLESPYGQGLSYEKSPRRRSLLSASLQSLSAGPVVSPSPQVSTLVSSPSPDLGDVPAISSSPLVDDNEITHSEHQDQGGSRDNQSGEPQGREPQQLRGIDTNNVSTSNPPTSSLPHPTFTSVLSGNISLMTNPLYPIISSSESSPSPPPSAPHIDGFNIPAVGINLPNAPSDMSPTSEEEIIPLESAAVFLQKRKAAAATQRQKGIGAGDPNSAASQAILKRRTQVLSTVQKARTRLSVLTYEVARKRRSFKNNCFGRFRRWLYERERKKMMGKIQFCLPACTENAVGIQLLRLIVMTTLINNAYELIYGFGYVWITSGNKRHLYIEDMAIDVVYVQSLVWVGSCFSPMASILGFFANLLTWYGMRLALFRTCGPVEKAHSATRTEVLTYGLLLLSLILSTIPATLNVMQRGSGFCGPIHEHVSQYTVLTSYIKRAPEGLWLTIQWLTNPAVLLGLILLLVFGVVLLQSKLVQSRQFLTLTKHEMGMQRREAAERLTRVRQNETSVSGTDAKVGPPRTSPLRRSSASTEGPASLGQVEPVNIPTVTDVRRGENRGSLRIAGLAVGKVDYPKIK